METMVDTGRSSIVWRIWIQIWAGFTQSSHHCNGSQGSPAGPFISTQSCWGKLCHARLKPYFKNDSKLVSICNGIFHVITNAAQDVALASMLLRPAPCLAFATARFDDLEEGGRVKRVPRVYIKTLQDRVLKAEQQEEMIKRWPPNSVLCLDTDHSPFFSAAAALCRMLLNVASNHSWPNYLEAVPTPIVYLIVATG